MCEDVPGYLLVNLIWNILEIDGSVTGPYLNSSQRGYKSATFSMTTDNDLV